MPASPRPHRGRVHAQWILIAAAAMTLLAGCGTSAADLEAADGTDLGACRDGDCEVKVSKPVDIPLDGEHGPSTVSITKIDGQEVSVTCATGDAGGSTGSGGATMSILSPDSGSLPCGRLSLKVEAVADGTAVFVISPG